MEEPRRLAAAQLGDPAALEWLFRTYHHPVYALCHRLLGTAEDTEDAAQAAFIAAFRGLPQFRGGSSLKTWLYRIAINEAFRILRQRKRKPVQLTVDQPAEDGAPEVIERAAISATIQRMRPEQRLILILFYWEDLTMEELAAVLEISISAAKMRLKRARDEFQRQYGGEC